LYPTNNKNISLFNAHLHIKYFSGHQNATMEYYMLLFLVLLYRIEKKRDTTKLKAQKVCLPDKEKGCFQEIASSSYIHQLGFLSLINRKTFTKSLA
jgi:hypothetical protein